MRSDEIDAAKAKADLGAAESALKALPDAVGRSALEAERSLAKARLDASTRG